MKAGEGRPIRELGENALVARFRELASAEGNPSVVVGPGDDTAVLRMGGERLGLLACDMMVEGIHFRREWASGEQIGWKAMAQNISDIAAMGGEPAFAVASVAAPGELEAAVAEGIAEGLVAAARSYGAALVGGDLVGSPGPVVVDVAVMGWVEEDRVVLRRGARPGDAVLVTGALGAAAAGLAALRKGLGVGDGPEVRAALEAHHRPRPRVREGRAIAATGRATAMMDLSDGLADDLPRLCARSEVGARVYASRIPIAGSCAAVAAAVGAKALDFATAGGEDYELLLTCQPEAVEEIRAAVMGGTGTPVTVIGEIAAGKGVELVEAGGQRRALGAGFDHFRS